MGQIWNLEQCRHADEGGACLPVGKVSVYRIPGQGFHLTSE